jgi:hypothetical protein
LAADRLFPNGFLAGLRKGVNKAEAWVDEVEANRAKQDAAAKAAKPVDKDRTAGPDEKIYHRPDKDPETPPAFTDTP